VELAQQVGGDLDGDRVVIAGQGRGGSDAVQKQSPMLDCRINQMDCGSCAAPDAERGRLCPGLFRRAGQFEDDLLTTGSSACENLGAKPTGKSAVEPEVPVSDAGAEPGRKVHVSIVSLMPHSLVHDHSSSLLPLTNHVPCGHVLVTSLGRGEQHAMTGDCALVKRRICRPQNCFPCMTLVICIEGGLRTFDLHARKDNLRST